MPPKKQAEKQRTYEELSDYEKFHGAVEGLKSILNEKLCDNFLMVTNRYVEGAITEERARIISPELQEIEAMLMTYKRSLKTSIPHMAELHLRNITKKIKELYGN